MSEVITIAIDCPDCLNANRQARRMCRRKRGMCGGTGRTTKTIPKPEPEPEPDRDWTYSIARHSDAYHSPPSKETPDA